MKISSQLSKVAKVSGAYFASTKDGAVILSGGGNHVQKIDLEFNGGDQAAVTISVRGSEPEEIIRGPVLDVMEGYIQFAREVTEPGRKHLKIAKRLGLLASVAFAFALGYISANHVGQTSPAANALASNQALAQMFDAMKGQIPQHPMETAPSAPEASVLPPVQPKPNFLTVPDELPALPSEPAQSDVSKPAETEKTVPTQNEEPKPEPVAALDENPLLPTYTPDLYVKPAPASTESKSSEHSLDVSGTEAEPAKVEPEVVIPKIVTPDSTAESKPEVTEVPVPEAVAVEPKTDAKSAEMPVSSGVDPEKVAASTTTPLTPNSMEPLAKTDANKAVGTLVDKGMTKYQALDVLNKLEALSTTDLTEITPEMLSSLPHEIVQMLKEKGIVDPESMTGQGGTPYAIIRLPEETVRKFRGKDGIASIPEANSWASRGNSVSIPLPGGGDIKTPEDLKAFGLQP